MAASGENVAQSQSFGDSGFDRPRYFDLDENRQTSLGRNENEFKRRDDDTFGDWRGRDFDKSNFGTDDFRLSSLEQFKRRGEDIFGDRRRRDFGQSNFGADDLPPLSSLEREKESFPKSRCQMLQRFFTSVLTVEQNKAECLCLVSTSFCRLLCNFSSTLVKHCK
jgi:hypothetical protein